MRLHPLGPNLITRRPIDFYDFKGDSPFDDIGVVESGGSVNVVNGSMGPYGSKHVEITHGDESNTAYMYRYIPTPPGEMVAVGFYFKQHIAGYNYPIYWGSGSSRRLEFEIYGSGTFALDSAHDDGYNYASIYGYTAGETVYIVFGYKRADNETASNGEVILYIDGVLRWHKTAIDNYDVGGGYDRFCWGQWGSVALDWSFGDIKIGSLEGVLL